MNSIKVDPKFNSGINSKIGLIALSTDFMIEKDFKQIIENMKIDLFVNRIRSYFPLTKETDGTSDIADEVKSVCNAVWTTSVKDAWKAKLIADKPSS